MNAFKIGRYNICVKNGTETGTPEKNGTGNGTGDLVENGTETGWRILKTGEHRQILYKISPRDEFVERRSSGKI